MYFLGIDVSTTATKALIIDGEGQIISVGAAEYPFETPQPLWSEQDPNLWWEGTIKAIKAAIADRKIDANEIMSIGLTGQMHGLVLLNKNDQILRKAILWNDQRTQEQCDQIHHLFGLNEFIRISGNVALTGFTAPKILWVRENEPEIYEKIEHILLPKDFVRLKLTGEYAMDKADGAGTVLMDISHREWSLELLEGLGIQKNWLPNLFEGTQVTGYLTEKAAKVTGLRPGIPIVAGGGDQAAQAVGVGAIKSGIVALTLGTSGVVFTSTDKALIEPQGRPHAFCHALPEKWHLMGVMLSAAGSLRWYRDKFAPGVNYDDLLKQTDLILPGSEGLLFLPYLTGERTPYPDPLARGAFIGITIRHEPAHFLRSILEGVAFGFNDIFALLQLSGVGRIEQVRISGGGAKSAIWRQIFADILNIELVTVNTVEGAAFGAAILAGVGISYWSSVEDACDKLIQITSVVKPQSNKVNVYQKQYQRYSELYPLLKDTFHKLE